MIKKLLIASLFFSLLAAFYSSRDQGGFYPDRILRQISWPNPSQDLSSLEPLLDQRFTFIGSGTQSAALLGDDGKTVLKIFLNRSLKPKRRIKIRPLFELCLEQHRGFLKLIEARDALRRYAMAFDRLKEESGLLATRLNPSQEPHLSVRMALQDGTERIVSLKGAPFVLQQYVEPVEKCLERETNVTPALKDLFYSMASKGCYERRRGFKLLVNYGLLDGKAYLIDAGQIEYSEELASDPTPEFIYLDRRFEEWERSRVRRLQGA